MKLASSRLGPKERRFLVSMASSDKRVFLYEDAIPFWTSAGQTRKALSRLVKKGWLKRLRRGLYILIPLEAGVEGEWSEDPMVIATQIVPGGAVSYWTALHHWNMTEQIPRTVFVQTCDGRYLAETEILGVRYQFIMIKQEKCFGVLTRTSDGMNYRITDREKTLIDALDRSDLSGGILLIAQALKSTENIDWDKLTSYLDRLGSGAVYKRLGYLVEYLNISLPARLLSEWQSKMTEGIAWLEPGGFSDGPVKTRWRVRVNVKGLE